MGDSVGRIGLDLAVNQNGFNRQMSGITGMAKKAGAALAAAFAVKKIVDFGAACIKLGSDLQEVQNVVNVTFPSMSKQVDKFAQDAAASFGLSETMAKKFTGTFGAMAKAFGLPEQAAYEMSTALTGLSGDVASFYNISQDEAFTKLKSVFTGETESLKDLGVVMTQSALDQYALANGFGKTTKAMSEGEKVALRYKFVQDQLSLASGDFIRTSDGWANQIRVLKLQFDSLKATIGQGLINVLTPVIKVINTIIGKLMSLANAFKAFTEMISGKKGSGGGAASTAGMDAVTESADHASAAMGGVGGAAKKAAKEIKTSTTGIDELNILSADAGGDSGGGSGGGYSADEFDMGEIDPTPVDELNSKYQGLINKVKELGDLFSYGFKIGFGDISVLDSVKSSIDGIKESLRGIFTDSDVAYAAKGFVDQFVYSLGKSLGAMTSIGASIADNVLGGVDLYLEQNSSVIKEFLVSMFDISSHLSVIQGQLAVAVAEIFTSFRSEDAKQITADIIGAFSNGFMGAVELGYQFGVDILDVLTAPLIENSDLIRTTLEDTFSAVEPLFAEIKSIVDEVFTGLKTTYDQSVGPMMDSFKQGFTEITTALLTAYNQHILPVLQGMSEKFGEFRDQYLTPLIDKFMEFFGKAADGITTLWTQILQPFVLFFIENVAPIISGAIQTVIDVFFALAAGVSGVIQGILTTLGGIIDFIVGVFTGDWERAWKGINDFFIGIWNSIKALVTSVIQAVVIIIKSRLNEIKTIWNQVWTAIKEFMPGIWDSIHLVITETIEKVRSGIEEKLTLIKTKWDEIWGGALEKIKDVFGGMWEFIRTVINNILQGVETMANGVVKAINTMIEAINSVADVVPGIGSEMIPRIPDVELPRLAQGGFVKANTPQLAMIGDNRHQGEVVAPEDKLLEMARMAAEMSGPRDNLSGQHLSMMVDLLRKIVELIENLDLVVNIDIREMRRKLKDLEKRSGFGFS